MEKIKTGVVIILFFIALLNLSSQDKILTGEEFRKEIRPLPETAVLRMDDWTVWGGSMVQTNDGTCHLLFARWPGTGTWLSHSEIALATADHPMGPYQIKRTVLPGRGGDFWDAQMTHNPTVKKIDDKYYLYYIGTRRGDTYEDYGDMHRTRDQVNLRVHQRIGVAVANHPEGPWERFDNPIVDVERGTIRHYFTCNPSVAERPDGGYLMVYKCMRRDGKVVHGVALADEPIGPFKCLDEEIFVFGDDNFAAEDPYIWVQDDHYYALVKDFRGHFTGVRFGLALFHSDNGIDWKLTDKPLFGDLTMKWEDGNTQHMSRMERPQLWLKDGKPAILFLGARRKDVDELSFNLHLPLMDF